MRCWAVVALGLLGTPQDRELLTQETQRSSTDTTRYASIRPSIRPSIRLDTTRYVCVLRRSASFCCLCGVLHIQFFAQWKIFLGAKVAAFSHCAIRSKIMQGVCKVCKYSLHLVAPCCHISCRARSLRLILEMLDDGFVPVRKRAWHPSVKASYMSLSNLFRVCQVFAMRFCCFCRGCSCLIDMSLSNLFRVCQVFAMRFCCFCRGCGCLIVFLPLPVQVLVVLSFLCCFSNYQCHFSTTIIFLLHETTSKN